MADAPLLDLSTLIVRPTIDIDGTRYELFSADELPVLTSHRLSIWGRRIEAIDAATAESDGDELGELIDNVCRAAIVDLPAEVFAALSGAHKRQVVDVFTALLLRNRLKAAGAMATAMGVPQIGERFFPGFNASLADRPAGGWWKRLRGWFARI